MEWPLKHLRKDPYLSPALQQVAIFMLLVAVFLIQNDLNSGGTLIYSPLDDKIPFIPAFIVAYGAWYFFIGGTGLYFLWKSREDLLKTFVSINICMVVGLLTYFFFPNYVELRPSVYGEDFFSQTVKALQDFDNASSVCPSLHVAVSVAVCTGILHTGCFRRFIGLKISAVGLTVLISVSTLFTKQHSIIDMGWGIVLGLGAYLVVYQILFRQKVALTTKVNRSE